MSQRPSVKGERVWRYIRSCEYPVHVRDIADGMGWTREAIKDHIYMMRKNGNDLIVEGNGKARTYVIPRGAVFMSPGRGSNPKSRANLKTWDWRKGLETMARKQGKTPPRPIPQTELERCWPL